MAIVSGAVPSRTKVTVGSGPGWWNRRGEPITIDPALGARFRRLAPGPANRKRAIVAVAHTLALRLRACWLSGQPYVIGVVR